MKRIIVAASLFIAFSASAQQGKDYRKVDYRNSSQIDYRFDRDEFKGIKLSSSQQKKIEVLKRQRISQKLYEVKLQDILTKKQFHSYLQNQRGTSAEQIKMAQMGGFRK